MLLTVQFNYTIARILSVITGTRQNDAGFPVHGLQGWAAMVIARGGYRSLAGADSMVTVIQSWRHNMLLLETMPDFWGL